MAKGFVVNANRFDPYKNFKFQIMWDGRIVVGISKVTALKRTTEVVKHREGGDNSTDRKSPGRTSYEAITLERGVTHDPEFEKWANLVHPLDEKAGGDFFHNGGKHWTSQNDPEWRTLAAWVRGEKVTTSSR